MEFLFFLAYHPTRPKQKLWTKRRCLYKPAHLASKTPLHTATSTISYCLISKSPLHMGAYSLPSGCPHELGHSYKSIASPLIISELRVTK